MAETSVLERVHHPQQKSRQEVKVRPKHGDKARQFVPQRFNGTGTLWSRCWLGDDGK